MSMSQVFSAYSDESGTFDHRFQSIAVVSGLENALQQLRSALTDILSTEKVYELKFSEIQGYHSYQAKIARRFIRCVLEHFIKNYRIRIDVLTWDIGDSRHNIPNRDDIANLKYMYYKVLIHIARQWNQVHWNLYPDNNSQIDWGAIKGRLDISSLNPSRSQQRTLMDLSQDDRLCQFKKIQQLDSIQEPIIQLADLFAGMARFSGEEGINCIEWLIAFGNRNQLRFKTLCTDKTKDKSTRIRECRYQLVGGLDRICKSYRLGVSLRKNNRLWTPNRNKPLNFWNYEPQGEYDRAPMKE